MEYIENHLSLNVESEENVPLNAQYLYLSRPAFPNVEPFESQWVEVDYRGKLYWLLKNEFDLYLNSGIDIDSITDIKYEYGTQDRFGNSSGFRATGNWSGYKIIILYRK